MTFCLWCTQFVLVFMFRPPRITNLVQSTVIDNSCQRINAKVSVQINAYNNNWSFFLNETVHVLKGTKHEFEYDLSETFQFCILCCTFQEMVLSCEVCVPFLINTILSQQYMFFFRSVSRCCCLYCCCCCYFRWLSFMFVLHDLTFQDL